jgi:hypothetical protein
MLEKTTNALSIAKEKVTGKIFYFFRHALILTK